MSTSRWHGPSTARRRAGSRGSSSTEDGGRSLAPDPAVAGRPGRQRLPAARPVADAAPERGGLAARLVAVGDACWRPTGSTSSPPIRRYRPPTTAFRDVDRGRRLPADRGDPAVAPSRSRCRSDRRGRGRRSSTASRSRPASGSAAPSGRGRVVRHDARSRPDGAGEGFAAPTETAAVALDRFYDLLLETGRATPFLVRSAAAVRRLVAGGARGRPSRLPRGARRRGQRRAARPARSCTATAAASRPSTPATMRRPRTTHPGALHLLRWRAIQLAIREGCAEMDLGGVDVGGRPRRADRGRSALRAVPAQAVVRWPVAGAHRRPRAGVRRPRATRGGPPGRPASDSPMARRADDRRRRRARSRRCSPRPNRPSPRRSAASSSAWPPRAGSAAPGGTAGRSARPAWPRSRSVA